MDHSLHYHVIAHIVGSDLCGCISIMCLNILVLVVAMCGIDFLFRFGFGSVFIKNSDSVWNEFSSVWFGYYSYFLLM